MPSDGYQGSYLVDLAKEVVSEKGDTFLKMPEAEATKELGQLGLEKMLAWIRKDLEMMRVYFNNWFSELSLYQNGLYEQ
jgi:arginyl-tRNA synthetase